MSKSICRSKIFYSYIKNYKKGKSVNLAKGNDTKAKIYRNKNQTIIRRGDIMKKSKKNAYNKKRKKGEKIFRDFNMVGTSEVTNTETSKSNQKMVKRNFI